LKERKIPQLSPEYPSKHLQDGLYSSFSLSISSTMQSPLVPHGSSLQGSMSNIIIYYLVL